MNNKNPRIIDDTEIAFLDGNQPDYNEIKKFFPNEKSKEISYQMF